MSETVLSIDTTVRPARAVIATVDGKSVEIVESHEFELGDLFIKSWGPHFDSKVGSNTETGGQLSDGQPVPKEQKRELQSEQIKNTARQLRSVLEKIKTPWESSVMVIPGVDYLSVNLELPFNESRKISRVVDLEVQDLVPFDVQDFVLDHHLVGKLEGEGYDVHVSLLPRDEMRGILTFCEESGIDPRLVSTPPSVIAGVFELAPNYFARDCLLIWAEQPTCALIMRVNGEVRASRILSSGSPISPWSPQSIAQQIKLSLSSIEQRYHITAEKVYLFGSSLNASELQNVLGRSIEEVKVSELVKNESRDYSLASLASVFARDFSLSVLTNFRTGEFSYRPQMKGLIAGLRTTLPHLALFVAALFIWLIGSYVLEASTIQSGQNLLRSQIKQAIPSIQLHDGQETQDMSRSLDELEKQLNDLGSLSKLSPLDALLEISKDIPVSTELSIFEVSIREDKLTIKGNVTNYSTIDKIEKAMKQKQDIYCQVSVQQDASFGSAKDFTLVLKLCSTT